MMKRFLKKSETLFPLRLYVIIRKMFTAGVYIFETCGVRKVGRMSCVFGRVSIFITER